MITQLPQYPPSTPSEYIQRHSIAGTFFAATASFWALQFPQLNAPSEIQLTASLSNVATQTGKL